YLTHMVIRDVLQPPDGEDFLHLVNKLSLDIQTLHTIRNTRYLRDRRHVVAKAGNIHLAWVYCR
ncbi:hypothetical protein R3P38DRAFT_2453738, partial [Favolaschia claudopus]